MIIYFLSEAYKSPAKTYKVIAFLGSNYFLINCCPSSWCVFVLIQQHYITAIFRPTLDRKSVGQKKKPSLPSMRHSQICIIKTVSCRIWKYRHIHCLYAREFGSVFPGWNLQLYIGPSDQYLYIFIPYFTTTKLIQRRLKLYLNTAIFRQARPAFFN